MRKIRKFHISAAKQSYAQAAFVKPMQCEQAFWHGSLGSYLGIVLQAFRLVLQSPLTLFLWEILFIKFNLTPKRKFQHFRFCKSDKYF